jgi:hypothetical protein
MYQIYYNDELVYDPRLANEPGDVSHAIEDGTLTLAVGSGGQLTITLPAGHPMIDTIELKGGIVTVVEVLPGGSSTVFLGRAISDEVSFDNSHSYQCEGALAFLNDSVVRPGSFPPHAWPSTDYEEYQAAVTANTTPAYRLGKLLEAHNAMTGSNIQLGTVTVPGGAMDYKAQDWLTTWERINSELLDVFGGFLNIRYSGATVYLDYLASTADFTEWNEQVIQIGENLAEITRKTGSSETFNAVLPIFSNGNPILYPIFVPDGTYDDGKYVKSGFVMASADAETHVVTVEEMTLNGSGAQVAQKVCDWLDANAGTVVNSLTVRAYDMSASDPATEPFRAGKLVKILDPPHGIREAYLVMGVTIDLTGGADVDLDLGARATSLTSSGAQRIIEEDTSKRVPQVLYRNTSPGTAQSSGALSNVGDISAYNLFFVECCWSTGYTSHRGGTWVYVPDGTAVIAHPSVDWTDSGTAHAYRQVTINKSASAGSQISLGTGNSATPSGTSSGTSYAIVTTIVGYTV